MLSFDFSNNYQRHHHQHHSLIMCKLQKNDQYITMLSGTQCKVRRPRPSSLMCLTNLMPSFKHSGVFFSDEWQAQLWEACEFCADNLFSAYTPTVETVEKPGFTTYAAANSICCLDTVINYTCDLSLGRPSHHSAKTANQCPPETSLKRWVYWHTI